MGFFNTLKDTIDETKRIGELKKVIYRKELEADPKRPSVKNLPFKVLNPSVANDPRLMEPKKVNKWKREQFIKCIREGRFSYVEVVALAAMNMIVCSRLNLFGSDLDDYEWRYYVKVADLRGIVQREIVLSLNKELPCGWKNGFFEDYMKNPDVINPAAYPHIFIIRYYIGDKECYKALTYDQFANLSFVVSQLDLDVKKYLDIDTDHLIYW